MWNLFAISTKLDLDYSYSELSDIVQLDGPADNSDREEEEEVPLEENDFLGLINAEAIKALQEENATSDSNSISSSSDGEAANELAIVDEVRKWSLYKFWRVMVSFHFQKWTMIHKTLCSVVCFIHLIPTMHCVD